MCNGTTTVFVTASASTSTATASAGATICPVQEQAFDEIRSREKTKGNAMIALAALWGCTLIVLAGSAEFSRRERVKLRNRLAQAEEMAIPQPLPAEFTRERVNEMARIRDQVRGAGGAGSAGVM